jgi:hypothetical protein
MIKGFGDAQNLYGDTNGWQGRSISAAGAFKGLRLMDRSEFRSIVERESAGRLYENSAYESDDP